jgi:ABC-type sugar transport system ATPase subunit
MTGPVEKPALVISGLRKSFGPVNAVTNATLAAYRGQALALMGANGAGKSTTVNMLGGLMKPDAGEIRINGQVASFNGPRAATEAGIAFVHQELSIFPTMSVAENIFIGDFPIRAGRIDRSRIEREAGTLLDALGAKMSPAALVSELSVGERQMVEIARAMRRSPDILIFDEPTSSLSSREKGYLKETIRALKGSGVAIIYITHFVSEIFEVCDRVVVMRNGETVADHAITDVDHGEVVRLMLGDIAVRERPARHASADAETILRVTGLSSPGRIDDASFDLRRGEILGLWGLLGAGRTEMVRGLLGLDGTVRGTIELLSDDCLAPVAPAQLRQCTAFVTEDRRGEGLLLPMSIADNIALPNLRTLSGRSGLVRRGPLRALAAKMINDLSIRVSGPEQRAETLSGGNQQKAVFGKWLATAPRILILDEPTRGLDLNAKADIIQLTRDLAASGVGVILISSELEELMLMSHRYLIISERRVTGTLPGSSKEAELISALSTSFGNEQAA